MPEAEYAADWEDPDPQSSWTLNRTGNVVLGGAARPEADWPCEEPFPCNRYVDGVAAGQFHPARMALLSLHNVRGRELVGQRGTVGRELCRRHYGYWTINARGRMAPVVFSLPNDTTRDDEIYASVGYATGRKTAADDLNEPRGGTDLLTLCRTNRMCAVAGLQNPEWIEGVFDSNLFVCGEPV